MSDGMYEAFARRPQKKKFPIKVRIDKYTKLLLYENSFHIVYRPATPLTLKKVKEIQIAIKRYRKTGTLLPKKGDK